MLNVPTGITLANYINALHHDCPSHIRITFTGQNVVLTDADIESSGIVLQDLLNGDTDLTFGRAVMATVQMPVLSSDTVSGASGFKWDDEFTFEIGLDVNGSTYWSVLGYFRGTRPEKINNVKIIDFTASDRMQMFDVLADEWLFSLTYPMTFGDMYHSLCTYVGIQYEDGDALSAIMNRSFDAAPIGQNGLTCREILALMAEACGCYAKITAGGKVRMVWFEDHASDYTVRADDEFAIDSFDIDTIGKTWEDLESFTWEQLEAYTWADLAGYRQIFAINAISVKQTEDDIGANYPTIGNTGNVYMIVDNPYLIIKQNSDITTYIKPLYDRLEAFGGYLPMNTECVGNPLIQSGDIITVQIDEDFIPMPIFVRTMHWNGALTDSYEATGKIQRDAVSTGNRVKLSEGGKRHEFRVDLDQLYSAIYDDQGHSKIEQNASGIELLSQNKYSIQSGIAIDPEGIEVTGGKYVKIRSGGTFDVDSTNFKLDSDNKIIQIKSANFNLDSVGIKMELGQFSYSQSGIWRGFTDSGNQYFYALSGDLDLGTFVGNDAGYAAGINFALNTVDSRQHESLVLYVRNKKQNENQRQGLLIFGAYNHVGVERITYSLYPSHTTGDTIYIGTQDSYFINGYIRNIYYYNLNQQSSRESKHDIKQLPSFGDAIDKLQPVSYVYNNDEEERKRFGLIHEDTFDVLPEICIGDKYSDPNDKGINYMDLVSILLKEIQDLRKRVAELERG